MKYILVGTNRSESRSSLMAKIVQRHYQTAGEDTEILDLKDYPSHLLNGSQYGQELPTEIQNWNDKVIAADSLYIIVPEYNGSLPGILKYFIDHLPYPDAFLFRPVCFLGLGGMFGGMRPVEHTQQIFGYRNSFIYPERLFIQNVWSVLDGEKLKNEELDQLLKDQIHNFCRYVKALKSENLHANQRQK